MRLIVLSLLLSAVSAAPLMAAEPEAQPALASPLVIGETFTIQSKA
ncbi:esterase, partial [Stenotrophomonas sp. HMWF022]